MLIKMNSKEKKRNIKNYNQVLRIAYQKNVLGRKIDKEDDLKINDKESLENAFNRFSTQRNILNKNEEENYFYLEKDGKHIKLNRAESIEKLGLKSGDKILITNEIVFDKKKHRDIKNDPKIYTIKNQNQKSNKKKIIIFIILLSILSIFIIGLGALLCYLLLRKRQSNEASDFSMYKEENLVTKIKYIENVLYRYKSEKNINMVVEGYNLTNNSEQNMLQYIDFLFILRKKYYEIDNNNEIKKAWFNGYISILNITINNGTDDMMIFYDKDLSKYINNLIKKIIIEI